MNIFLLFKSAAFISFVKCAQSLCALFPSFYAIGTVITWKQILQAFIKFYVS